MTNVTQKKNATAPSVGALAPKPAPKAKAPKPAPKAKAPKTFKVTAANVIKIITQASDACGRSENARANFKLEIAHMARMGFTGPDIMGKKGKEPAGKYHAVMRDTVALRMLTPTQYVLVLHSDKKSVIDGKVTLKGKLEKDVNSRIQNIRNALVEHLEVKAKGGAARAPLNSVESTLKKLLDEAAKVAKLKGEAKTEAQTQAKALWVSVDANHAALLECYDKIVANAGKRGGGKN